MPTDCITQPEPANNEWTMPPVHVGDIVLQRTDGQSKSVPALVQEVTERTISVMAFPPLGIVHGIPLNGLRHKDDPLRQKHTSQGFWEYSQSSRILSGRRRLEQGDK